MTSTDLPDWNHLPPDHRDRTILAEEVHARPPEAQETPSRTSYIAVLIDPAARDQERLHLTTLCTAHGVASPAPSANHFTADLGTLRIKWERHGEFSGYTFVTPGRSPTPFSDPPVNRLPAGWLAAVPGRTIFAAHVKMLAFADVTLNTDLLAAHFGSNVVVGSDIGNGAGQAYTDFKINGRGFGRFLVLNRSFTPRQAGRMLQRLFEIETYRMMALLALPLARDYAPQVAAMERTLADLTKKMAQPGADDDAMLRELTQLAAGVHKSVSATQFRFNAARAYHELVKTRISELRETRLPGLQPIEEFMQRRFSPAVATCVSLAQRLQQLSERVSQASSLLSTRVDIVREHQNQMLLASMNRRAALQFRLQRTVEGLSVVAIVYYLAGLTGYVANALKASKVAVDPDLVVGTAIPLLIIVCVVTLARAHRQLKRLSYR